MQEIPSYLFNAESAPIIKTLTMGGGVERIGTYAFFGQSELKEVILPESLIEIEAYAFSGCSSLTSLTIPNKVNEIGSNAFTGCTSLMEIRYNAVSVSNPNQKQSIFLGSGTAEGVAVTIGDSVREIPSYLFNTESAPMIKTLTMGGGVERIGAYAFFGQSALQEVILPESLVEIGSYAFSGCSALTSINIPEKVASLGQGVLKDCISLEEVTIPFVGERADGEGNNCFGFIFGNYNNINVPESLRIIRITDENIIGYSAFSDCFYVEEIILPDNLLEIDGLAFSGCCALTKIVIPVSVEYISFNVFLGCERLIIYCENSRAINWSSNWNPDARPVVWSYQNICTDSVYDYVVKEGKAHLTNYKGEETVVEIPSMIDGYEVSYFGNIFAQNKNIEMVIIPDTVTTIGKGAFEYCWKLTNLTIGKGLTEIGEGAFYWCSQLKQITFPISLKHIGENAFAFCASIQSITIPVNVTYIGEGAFQGCDNVKNVTVETGNLIYHSIDNCLIETKSKTLIAGFATSIIPDDGTVTIIGNYSFYNCNSLISIYIPNTITTIGDHAFSSCDSLTRVIVPNSVQKIGAFAFSFCQMLTEIKIGDEVVEIENSAFSYCSSLEKIIIPEKVEKIGMWAFQNCERLTIYCRTSNQPAGWHLQWNPSACPVVWEFQEE